MKEVLDGLEGEIMHLNGKVTSGRRDFSGVPDDLFNLYKEHTGMINLVKGTLNIELEEEYELESPDKFPWRDISIFLKKCRISFEGKEADAFIVRSGVTPYSKRIIELISEIHFKTNWRLIDNDEVLIYL